MQIIKLIYNMYDFIPYIACINIFEREDKYVHMTKQFKKHKIDHLINFHRNNKNKNGKYGCWKAHMDVYIKALERGSRCALIFEDDIAIDNLNILNEIKSTILDDNWEYILLNNSIILKVNDKIATNIYKGIAITTRCYLIHENGMKKMLNSKYENIHIDAQINNKLDVYFCRPPMTYDVASKSDNDPWEFNDDLYKKSKSCIPKIIIKYFQYFIQKMQNYTHIIENCISIIVIWIYTISNAFASLYI